MESKILLRSFRDGDEQDICHYIFARQGGLFTTDDEIFRVMNQVDPGCIFVAEDTSTGKILGVCISLKVSQNLSYIGGYSVHKDHQGKGIGSMLWKACMDRCGDDNVVIITGRSMQEKYRTRWNFNVIPSRLDMKYRLAGKINQDLIKKLTSIRIESIGQSNIEAVVNYDYSVCGAKRTNFIKLMSSSKRVVALTAINDNSDIVGYAIFQNSLMGWLLCLPVYADNDDIAELLISHAFQLLPETVNIGMSMMFWSDNLAAKKLAEKLGLQLHSTSIPMYTKSDIMINTKKMYSLSRTSFYPF